MLRQTDWGLFQSEAGMQTWLLSLAPKRHCGQHVHITHKTMMGSRPCCQEHTIRDILAHGDMDGISDEDREGCRLALRWIEAGNGVEAAGPRTLVPNSAETEIEH